MGAFDDPRQWTDATSARTRARRAKEAAEREESAVTGRNVLDLEQTVVDLKSRIAVVEHWQDTAQGKDGISVNGNVFSGQRKEAAPPPVTNTYTYLHPYVMRSKKFGSVDPDDDTAALTVDLANPDTWDRDNPPQMNAVNITSGGTTGGTPTVTTAAHGIAVGTSVRVVFAGTNSSPSIDGSAIATYVSATVVSLSVPVALTVAATAGTMAIVCDGVTLGPEQRHYKFNSGSGTFEEKVFAREKKWDSCGELYYIGPEVIIQTAIISGSGSASGGLP